MFPTIPSFNISNTGQLIFLLILLVSIVFVFISRRKMSERLWKSAVESNSVEQLIGMAAIQMNYHFHTDTDYSGQRVTHFMVPFLGDIACKRTFDGTPILYISRLKESTLTSRSRADALRDRFNDNNNGEHLEYTVEGNKLVWSLTLTLNTQMVQTKEMAKRMLRGYINRAKEIQKSIEG